MSAKSDAILLNDDKNVRSQKKKWEEERGGRGGRGTERTDSPPSASANFNRIPCSNANSRQWAHACCKRRRRNLCAVVGFETFVDTCSTEEGGGGVPCVRHPRVCACGWYEAMRTIYARRGGPVGRKTIVLLWLSLGIGTPSASTRNRTDCRRKKKKVRPRRPNP